MDKHTRFMLGIKSGDDNDRPRRASWRSIRLPVFVLAMLFLVEGEATAAALMLCVYIWLLVRTDA